jgi:hypothetical protein
MRNKLQPGELILTADFGVHPVHGNTTQLPTLVFVCHFIGTSGDLEHCYLDCVPAIDKKESKDWNYVRSCLLDLFASGFFKDFRKIIWWSDTGPNHFRTSNTLRFFRTFQETTGMEFCVYFFCPYHGHSMCDGHLGASSRKLRYEGARLTGLASWTRAWAMERIATLEFTQVVSVTIDRAPKSVDTVQGIKTYLVFSFDPLLPNTVTVSEYCGGQTTLLQFDQLTPAKAATCFGRQCCSRSTSQRY